MIRWALLSIPVLLTGCAVPRAEISPEGRLEIFGGGTLGASSKLSRDWVIEGEGNVDKFKRQISLERDKGAPTGKANLILKSGTKSFLLVRRTKARLLATPFITWSWRMTAKRLAASSIHLVVGFHGGNPKSQSWGAQPFVWFGTRLPPHDRVIAIQWGEQALERGNLYTDHKVPRYIARGGSRQLGRWWPENLDLAAIYRQVWPKDKIGDTKIMFIGFAVVKSPNPIEGSFRGISLYR